MLYDKWENFSIYSALLPEAAAAIIKFQQTANADTPGGSYDSGVEGLKISVFNSKTTAVRVIPAIGKKVGEELNFGGLLGNGPVMKVSTYSPAKFINRGGQIPAPMQSLKN